MFQTANPQVSCEKNIQDYQAARKWMNVCVNRQLNAIKKFKPYWCGVLLFSIKKTLDQPRYEAMFVRFATYRNFPYPRCVIWHEISLAVADSWIEV